MQLPCGCKVNADCEVHAMLADLVVLIQLIVLCLQGLLNGLHALVKH